MSNNNKVAKLVYVSLMARVIVSADASDDDIWKLAQPKLKATLEESGLEILEDICDDNDCPYDEEDDKVIN